MSRGLPRPERPENPIKHYLYLDGKWTPFDNRTGGIYAMKGEGETRERVYLTLPANFIILDECCSASGFHQERPVYSNRHPVGKSPVFKIWKDKNLLISGEWATIKNDPKAEDIHFYKEIFFLIPPKNGDGEHSIGVLSIKGGPLYYYNEFVKTTQHALDTNMALEITGFEEKKGKASNSYACPIFSLTPITEEDQNTAKKQWEILNEFLQYQYSYNDSTEEGTVSERDTILNGFCQDGRVLTIEELAAGTKWFEMVKYMVDNGFNEGEITKVAKAWTDRANTLIAADALSEYGSGAFMVDGTVDLKKKEMAASTSADDDLPF